LLETKKFRFLKFKEKIQKISAKKVRLLEAPENETHSSTT